MHVPYYHRSTSFRSQISFFDIGKSHKNYNMRICIECIQSVQLGLLTMKYILKIYQCVIFYHNYIQKCMCVTQEC